MAKGETWAKWAKENVVRVYVNLNKTNDADILDELDKHGSEARGAVLKRLIRRGMNKPCM